MSDEAAEFEPSPGDNKKGGAGWVMTFADLMSLLMCFFVLLLSFSEMDVLKFKRLAGSMRTAFGVQAEFRAEDVPKGTSIIAQEFSPGKPDPTPLNEIWQKTTDSTRSSRVCSSAGMSPISSRNSVPPSAARMRPSLACCAPVKAPFSWPISSDSSSPSGIAPQLIGTNGLSRRGLARWMARASNSLPVPLSPVISTLVSVRATRRACSRRDSIAGLRVTMSARQASGTAQVAETSSADPAAVDRLMAAYSTAESEPADADSAAEREAEDREELELVFE